ncbi:class I SAM-dependent methyltransferase [Pseudophaeobacter profundi]|uniref:class I SAM-dependent methyltransferase n=1 Tax=Pseudophaeobacter profundi TaxID=3034152 RepID=UPI00242DF492|nr:class I SAM-dependent methyltransferase [Pseudophaeobacter profundi]
MSDWDDRYKGSAYFYGTEPTNALLSNAHLFPASARVLCVADGEGRNSVWLAENGYQVTAWDASGVAVEKARKLAAKRGVDVSFSVADAADYDWSAAQYDVVVGIFIQFAAPELRDRMFEGMKIATKSGGLIFLHGYGQRQLEYGTGGPPCADFLYTEDLLRNRFSDMLVHKLEAYEVILSEGVGHSGRSAVMDLIAKRQ